MNRNFFFQACLSMVSLAVVVSVFWGVSLISDTSGDVGNRRNVVYEGSHRFVPASVQREAPAGRHRSGSLDRRV